MTTTKKITRQDFVKLIADGNRIEQMAEILNIPKSKVREGMKVFNVRFPRASKGGVVIMWDDNEDNDTVDNSEVTEVNYEVTQPEAEPVTSDLEEDIAF